MDIIESIYKEPEKWRATEYTFVHQNGAQLWTKNGRLFCQPYPAGSFNILKRFQAFRAYRWWCNNAPIEAWGYK